MIRKWQVRFVGQITNLQVTTHTQEDRFVIGGVIGKIYLYGAAFLGGLGSQQS